MSGTDWLVFATVVPLGVAIQLLCLRVAFRIVFPEHKRQVVAGESNARQKWKDTGDPVWAYAEAALAWARGSNNVEPSIVAVLEGKRKEAG